jgi:hypothetical protein
VTAVVEEMPTLDPGPGSIAARGRLTRFRLVALGLALAVVGTASFLLLPGSEPTPQQPPGLSWFWNGTFAEGGIGNVPAGYNITWGHGTPGQAYPADARCALVVPGAQDLINVSCYVGDWHWAGTSAPPKVGFLVTESGQATVFPVP